MPVGPDQLRNRLFPQTYVDGDYFGLTGDVDDLFGAHAERRAAGLGNEFPQDESVLEGDRSVVPSNTATLRLWTDWSVQRDVDFLGSVFASPDETDTRQILMLAQPFNKNVLPSQLFTYKRERDNGTRITPSNVITTTDSYPVQTKWPTPDGWEARIERTIFKLACRGKAGQIARFDCINVLRIWETDDTTDPLNGASVVTPTTEQQYAGQLFKHDGTQWNAIPAWDDAAGRYNYPDDIVLHRLMRDGDIVGVWVPNQITQALKRLTRVVAWMYTSDSDYDAPNKYVTYLQRRRLLLSLVAPDVPFQRCATRNAVVPATTPPTYSGTTTFTWFSSVGAVEYQLYALDNSTGTQKYIPISGTIADDGRTTQYSLTMNLSMPMPNTYISINLAARSSNGRNNYFPFIVGNTVPDDVGKTNCVFASTSLYPTISGTRVAFDGLGDGKVRRVEAYVAANYYWTEAPSPDPLVYHSDDKVADFARAKDMISAHWGENDTQITLQDYIPESVTRISPDTTHYRWTKYVASTVNVGSSNYLDPPPENGAEKRIYSVPYSLQGVVDDRQTNTFDFAIHTRTPMRTAERLTAHPVAYNVGLSGRTKSGDFISITGDYTIYRFTTFSDPIAEQPVFTKIGTLSGTGRELFGQLWDGEGVPLPWEISDAQWRSTWDPDIPAAQRDANAKALKSFVSYYLLIETAAVIDFTEAYEHK